MSEYQHSNTPLELMSATQQYCVDAWQRSVLFWDVLRQRGNQYIEHEQSGKPPVLIFDYQIIEDARKFKRPANYALALVISPDDCVPTDPLKRPFVVVDPRAGQGPGIGGFKMDSEIGIALRAGHPCYFIMFFLHPVKGQTIECVIQAKRQFLKTVNKRHPDAPGKPFVIGNCQGGWAVAIVAALDPESVGPLLLAGTPMSYWAGVEGKNPMRYVGGLAGGTWMGSLASDVGNGRFDGVYLVKGFERLNPGLAHWGKFYRLYANVDIETERYLEFERWWGGHFDLNKDEMEWIAQKLFVGNELSAGKIEIDDEPVDLREIRSPIVVFASWGDNITPPHQALNWIADLYDNAGQIRDNEQTIVYFLHEKVGHLGIFVSSAVAEREHNEFVSALDLIDVLPSGLYEAVITDTTPDMPGLNSDSDRYVIRFEPREVADILALGDGREGEKAFELVRHVSEINQAAYDKYLSPIVRGLTTEWSATFLRNTNSARRNRYLLSDWNPVLKALKPVAESVRAQRMQLSADSPWLAVERKASDQILKAWDRYRAKRDDRYEKIFKAIYESPFVGMLVGFRPDMLANPNHGINDKIRARQAEHEQWFENGSIESGFLRLLIYVAIGNGVVDERPFNGIRRLMAELGLDKKFNLQQLKDAIRRQTLLVRMDEERALNGLTKLLPVHADRQRAIALARQLLELGGPIRPGKQARLQRVEQVLQLTDSQPAISESATAKRESPRKRNVPGLAQGVAPGLTPALTSKPVLTKALRGASKKRIVPG